MSTKPVRIRKINARLQGYDVGGGARLTKPGRRLPVSVSVQHGHLAAGGSQQDEVGGGGGEHVAVQGGVGPVLVAPVLQADLSYVTDEEVGEDVPPDSNHPDDDSSDSESDGENAPPAVSPPASSPTSSASPPSPLLTSPPPDTPPTAAVSPTSPQSNPALSQFLNQMREEMDEMEAVEINNNDSNRNIHSPNNSQAVLSSPVHAQTLSQAGLSSSQEVEVEDILIATPQSDELPSQQEAHRTRIPTLTHVPKAARGQWSKFCQRRFCLIG